MAKGKPNPFAKGKAAAPGKKAPPFGKGAPDPDAAEDAAGFKRGGKAKRK
jgi:hypothetical protein